MKKVDNAQRYKQTPFGLLPQEWEVKKLQEISPHQSVGLVINPSSYFDKNGSVPMLVGSKISENYIEWRSANTITEESNKNLPASRVYCGDLVMVRVGEPGTTAVIPPELNGCNCASMMIIRQHKSFDSLWLCYVLNSKLGKSQVDGVQYGTAQKQFNISDAVNFVYPVPPIPEQKRIAEVLSDVDKTIAALDRLIAKKRDIKTATMQQLLTGKTRLPGFSGEWEEKKLAELAYFLKGKGLSKKQIQDTGTYPCIHYGELFTFYHESIRKTKSYTEKNERLCLGIKNDVLMPTSDVTPNGLAKASCLEFSDVIIGGDILIIRCNPNEINGIYLSYLIRFREPQILQLVTGSTVFHIYASDMKRFSFCKPGVEEQKAIAQILSDIDQEIETLENKRNKYKQIKQGMMQELLTGRTRLINNEQLIMNNGQ